MIRARRSDGWSLNQARQIKHIAVIKTYIMHVPVCAAGNLPFFIYLFFLLSLSLPLCSLNFKQTGWKGCHV